MAFHSMQFAIFLIATFSLYWLLPFRFRWALVLAASYYFYMSWHAAYLGLIVFTTAVTYASGRLIDETESPQKKRFALIAALAVCLGVLFFFKYFNFFVETIAGLLRLSVNASGEYSKGLRLLLPVGISFYTFQTLAYVIDVYRGELPAEKHFGYYAAFIAFFPQLVAGPIERSRNLLPQLREERQFSCEQGIYGLKLMAVGYFKKLVIADNLAVYVDRVFSDLPSYTGLALAVATVFFAFQIYCDFSGYSDIAIGCAKLFGVDLMQNFKSPYFAGSIKEFWSRWHISLSTWFRDYVYIPLGGNRKGRCRRGRNVMLTFLASGLWHGANWTFVLWGGYHGLLQVAESEVPGLNRHPKNERRRWRALSVCGTFLLVCVGWIFFRANSLPDAWYVLTHLLEGSASPIQYCSAAFHALKLRVQDVIGLCAALTGLGLYDYFSQKYDLIAETRRLPGILRWSVYLLLILTVMAFAPVEADQAFLYFQF